MTDSISEDYIELIIGDTPFDTMPDYLNFQGEKYSNNFSKQYKVFEKNFIIKLFK